MRPRQHVYRAAIFLLVLAGTAALGFVDYITGYELGLFVFYFAPIAAAAWYCGRREAVLVAFASATAWYFADIAMWHPYSSRMLEIWETLIRLSAFLIIAWAFSRIRRLLEREHQIAVDLREAMSRVKTLEGLLPICTRCRKIRTDHGAWQQIEQYMAQHADVEFTHCLCDECADELMRQARLQKPADDKSSPSAATPAS